MKLVIEISKEDFMYLKDAFESGDWERQRIAEMKSAELLLHDSTILQGHGRLIDADSLLEQFRDGTEGYDGVAYTRYEIGNIINLEDTIIEADKEDD